MSRLVLATLAASAFSCVAAARPATANERQAWVNCSPVVLWSCQGNTACGDERIGSFEGDEDRFTWLTRAGCPNAVLVGRVNARDYMAAEPARFPPPAPTIYSGSRGGPVRVRGYLRSNGTYVAPYTRSRPRH